jgi:hypothetical protein
MGIVIRVVMEVLRLLGVEREESWTDLLVYEV